MILVAVSNFNSRFRRHVTAAFLTDFYIFFFPPFGGYDKVKAAAMEDMKLVRKLSPWRVWNARRAGRMKQIALVKTYKRWERIRDELPAVVRDGKSWWSTSHHYKKSHSVQEAVDHYSRNAARRLSKAADRVRTFMVRKARQIKSAMNHPEKPASRVLKFVVAPVAVVGVGVAAARSAGVRRGRGVVGKENENKTEEKKNKTTTTTTPTPTSGAAAVPVRESKPVPVTTTEEPNV